MSSEGNRLLFVGHSAQRCGAELLGLNLVKTWTASQGCEVHTLLLNGGELVDEYARVSRTLHVLSMHERRNFREVSRIVDQFRSAGCDRAVCNTIVSGTILPLLHERGVTSISLIHELPATIHALNLLKAAQNIGSLAEKVIFPARIVCEGFEHLVPVDADRVLVRPQGLFHDCRIPYNPAEIRLSILRKLAFPENVRLVMSAGNLEMRKGADLLPAIASQVLSEVTNVAFVWIGNNASHPGPWLEHDIVMAGLSSRIRLMPAISDWITYSEYYAASDLFLLPSREDPFPSVALEAMNYGLPVICFENATGIAEIVSRERAGAVVPYLDSRAMAREIAGLLVDQVRWKQASSNATEYSRRHPDMQEYAQELLEILYEHTAEPGYASRGTATGAATSIRP